MAEWCLIQSSSIVWYCNMNTGDGMLLKLNINGKIDRTQVPRGKGEKNFDKRVKRT